MLVATSTIYALVYGTFNVLMVVFWCPVPSSYGFHFELFDFFAAVNKTHFVTDSLVSFVVAYNFYVYLLTGKRFRFEVSFRGARPFLSLSSIFFILDHCYTLAAGVSCCYTYGCC